MTHSRRAAVALATAAVVAWCCAFAESATAMGATTTPVRTGGFSITPPTHLLRGAPGVVLPVTVIGNTTSQALRVTVVPVLVRQTRSGSFTYSLAARARRAARQVLAVSTTGFALPAGARQAVYERWRPGARHRNTWAGVIFRELPAGETTDRAGVHTVDQLLGLDLMALRGNAPARGRIEGLSVADSGAHRVALTLALRNVGATFGTPTRMRELIRAADGRVVARLSPAAGVILPGVTRDFTDALTRRLPAGRYTATATADMPGRLGPRTLHFAIAPDGLLLAPSLVAGTVTAAGRIGAPDVVYVALRNQGTRPGAPHGTVALYALRGNTPDGPPVARATLTGPPVGAGRSATEPLRLGHLRRGRYRVVVTYAAPFVATNPAQVDFAARPVVSPWLAAWRFIRDHALVLALALVAAGALGFSGWRTRQGPGRTAAPGIHLRPLP